MKKTKNIFWFFVKMILIFIVIDFSITFLANLLLGTTFIYKYGQELIVEIFYALLVLIVMLLFKNSYVFTNKQEKFKKSISYGLPMILVSIIFLVSSIFSLDGFSIPNFINVLIFCIFIGIAEEFLCRGWIQNEFIERYSKDKKSVILSIILSSLVFGLMHITNVTTQSLFETILQIINATAMGVFLGSIYYKTKNIWSVIFLHSFYDFSIFLGEMNLVKDCTYATPTMGIVIVNSLSIIVTSLFWIFSAIYVIKKTDYKDEKANLENKNTWVKVCIVITFILMFAPFNLLVPEMKDYMVCYNYETIDSFENYVVHYPNYRVYDINETRENLNYIGDDTLEEGIIDDVYGFEFELKDEQLYVKNKSTGYQVKLDLENVYNYEVIEDMGTYMLLIETYDMESTIYYSDYITKYNMTNEKSYLDNLKNSFIKFEVPIIDNIGYVTFDNKPHKYPIMESNANDKFIIIDKKLYLISNK